MLLIMLVTFYTSRVVLNVLGVVNYGVYNVVGGIVAMFTFLNSALAQATQRYITFGLKKYSVERQKRTFSMLMNVHVIIALLIFIICETIGTWLFFNKMVIPEKQMHSAFWVMQCSIISMIITVTQVPYNASIFGHEKMEAYAYISIFEVALKLCSVLLLKEFFYDKLLSYGVLSMGCSFLIAFTYRMYCKKYFKNCNYVLCWSNSLFKDVFSFTSWSLIGNMAFTFNGQGMNILINIFFGPIFNAARGIASSVESAIYSFVYNFTEPSIPPIIKSYAANDIQSMIKLHYRSSKFAFLLFMCLSMPIICAINEILNFWLVKPPYMANVFCVLSLLYIQCNTLAGTLQNVVQAIGKVKRFQLTYGVITILAMPLTYVLYKLHFMVITYLLVLIVTSIISFAAQLIVVNKLIKEYSIKGFLKNVTFRELSSIFIPLTISLYIFNTLHSSLFVLSAMIGVFIICLICTWCMGLTSNERYWIKNVVSDKLNRFLK